MADRDRSARLTTARAVAELLLARDKPADIATRYGIAQTTLRTWKAAVDADPDLATLCRLSLAQMLEGWRPEVRTLLREIAGELRTRVRDAPGDIPTADLVGILRHLGELVGQADALARRSGIDNDDGTVAGRAGAELDS